VWGRRKKGRRYPKLVHLEKKGKRRSWKQTAGGGKVKKGGGGEGELTRNASREKSEETYNAKKTGRGNINPDSKRRSQDQ